MKKKNKKQKEFRKMLLYWLDNDMVKSGYVYDKVEKRNEAFARGDKTLSAQLHKEAWSK